MKARLTICVLCLGLGLCGMADTAAAYGPFSPYYGMWAYGNYAWGAREYSPPNAPYFALHPPVHYSHAVQRPYGLSPFAYPPGLASATSVGVVEPLRIRNPYVANASLEGAYADSVRPLRIVNPYVARPGDTGVSPEAVMPPRTQIIRPAEEFSDSP